MKPIEPVDDCRELLIALHEPGIAHLSNYLERGGFPSWGGQKRIGVSLNRGVKIESAKTSRS
jgi:hypothetical protein